MDRPSSGIRFKIACHPAEPIEIPDFRPVNRKSVVGTLWRPSTPKTSHGAPEYTRCKEVFQTSLGSDATDFASFLPLKNGFVQSIIRAYNRHHELIIRPDDVWIAILSQMNAYVNANAEDLRNYFVTHEGQKELVLIYHGYTRYTMDFSIMARDFAGLLKENINDPALYDIIRPSFSTTTDNDITICSVMMMSILKSYFSYTCELTCGIPAVTLLGEKADYESILARLDKFDEMGVEAKAFTALLRPIIGQFIATFDAVAAGREPNIDFWGKVCHERSMGSGSSLISGWLTAFCVWDGKGKWQGPKDIVNADSDLQKLDEGKPGENTFDASVYGSLPMDNIPVGFADVPVKLIDNGVELSCMMVAGHVGARMSGTGDLKDTLQPEPHWFMFEVETLKKR